MSEVKLIYNVVDSESTTLPNLGVSSNIIKILEYLDEDNKKLEKFEITFPGVHISGIRKKFEIGSRFNIKELGQNVDKKFLEELIIEGYIIEHFIFTDEEIQYSITKKGKKYLQNLNNK